MIPRDHILSAKGPLTEESMTHEWFLGAVYFTPKDRQFQQLRTVFFSLDHIFYGWPIFVCNGWSVITALISKKYEKFEFWRYFFSILAKFRAKIFFSRIEFRILIGSSFHQIKNFSYSCPCKKSIWSHNTSTYSL